ncbi:MAG: peptidoglycan bridge formation glycyltransferase FemA/FemB family protein [Anaerolineales bacterium]|jgi:lipid II:glycine glycyltransferase (peptidoglycan interpeptide bridge formation enzyme)
MRSYNYEIKGFSDSPLGFEVIETSLMDDPAWDAFVESHPHGQFTQTSLWAQVRAVQGWQPVRIIIKETGHIVAGVQILTRLVPFAGKVGVIWRGPLYDFHQPALCGMIFEIISDLCKRLGVRFLALSLPSEDANLTQVVGDFGFVKNLLGDIDSQCDIVVDLSSGLEQILARMSSKRRKVLRRADNRGIVIREGTAQEVDVFYDLHVMSAQRQGFTPYSRKFYQKLWHIFAPGQRVKLFIAEYEGRSVSAQIVILFKDMVSAYKIGWNRQHANLYPNDKLDWYTICWAKEQGYRWYNFLGVEIPVAEALRRGQSIPHDHKYTYSDYKLGFGGQPVFYPPSYERVFLPGEKYLYRVVFANLKKIIPIHRLVLRYLLKRTAG